MDDNDDHNIDIDLSTLQLHDFPNIKLKINEFFQDWLLSTSNDSSGPSLLIELKQSLLLLRKDYDCNDNITDNINDNVASILPVSSMYFAPPLSPNRKSPKKRTQSEMMLKNESNEQFNNQENNINMSITTNKTLDININNNNESNLLATTRRRSNFDSIPIFYKPNHALSHRYKVDSNELLTNKLIEIESFFKPFKNEIPIDKFVHVTKRLCNFPSYFNVPLCYRIIELYDQYNQSINKSNNSSNSNIDTAESSKKTSSFTSFLLPFTSRLMSSTQSSSSDKSNTSDKITIKMFLHYWKNEMELYDQHERFYRLIKSTNNNYIIKDDFLPYINELLRFHPGLDFLDGHDEFQKKYALTVITRIFYKVNTSRSGKITLNEIRKSKLLYDFIHVDEETEINRVREYFAYEHFYVLYCRFFELDNDKDSKLLRDDLMKYGDHSLSQLVIDRVFQCGQRSYTDGYEGGFHKQGGLSYPDFIYFMLSEEDKSNEMALRYWFTCCDLDGDGILTPAEMNYFYKIQVHRLNSLGQETINFNDVLCQLIDMLSPRDPLAITLSDLLQPDKRKISGIIFDILFNLNKFLRFEMRDPFQEKMKREDGFNNDWDRFAHYEYHRLAAEEEGNSNNNSSYNSNNNSMYITSTTDDDDYNMFSEDDSDNGESIHSHYLSQQNNMSIDNSKSKVTSHSQYSDWSLDDETDSDDDYQITSNSKRVSNSKK